MENTIKKKAVFYAYLQRTKSRHFYLAHSSDMPFSKELPDLIITVAKGIEGTEFLTKCAQHLPEQDFSNAFVYQIFPSRFSR